MKRQWVAAFALLMACGSNSGGPGGQADATTDVTSEGSDRDTGGQDMGPSETGLDATTTDAADGSLSDAGADVGDAAPVEDGGPTDAAQTSDAPPSLCPGNFLFCDGFEQGLTNWTGIGSSAGQVSVDSVHVYRGAKALHSNLYAVAEAGAQATALVGKYGTQPWPTHVFTRMFVYVPSPSMPSIEGVLNLLYNGAPYSGLELRLVPPNAALAMETYSTGADQTWQSADASAPLDQWVCFEVEVDTVAETSHLYMNDTEVTDLAGSNLALMQLGITNVGLTLPSGSLQGPSDAWMDEVAVNSARIGCND